MDDAVTWWGQLEELGRRLEACVRGQVIAAANGGAVRLADIAGAGVGDTTFALDVEPEAVVLAWSEECARRGPLSVLTEDSGWRHLGPGPNGEVRTLGGFDHDGPCIIVDPVDGTRNLMFDLRSAWCELALVPPRTGRAAPPRQSEVAAGMLVELPPSRAGRGLRLRGWCQGWAPAQALGPDRTAPERGCLEDLFDLPTEPTDDLVLVRSRALAVDDDRRVDNGFLPFFRYHPHQRAPLAAVEAAFFARLEAHEGADLRDVYDDQYISNAGQLVLLAQGRYRFLADLRAALARTDGGPPVTSKPYDLAGAVVCARGAGAVVHDAFGADLDFPLDATTPVAWVAYHNLATAERLAPHLAACLR
ncbi:MAG: hypothetical protein P1V81_00630 [Planctomycetota bacterium]|nr:hypothetical protein [Planctomycetota bacterium]